MLPYSQSVQSTDNTHNLQRIMRPNINVHQLIMMDLSNYIQLPLHMNMYTQLNPSQLLTQVNVS